MLQDDARTTLTRAISAPISAYAVFATLLALLLAGPTGTAGAVPGQPHQDVIGQQDGRIGGAEVTAFDTDLPAIAKLDPRLRAALQRATRAAGQDGEELRVNSGWRSPAYQQYLLDQAVAQYGSYDAARQWVNTPEESTHVTGDAVDVGPPEAAHWLDQHGARWGLCRVYANEAWHFELRTTPGGDCPALVEAAG
jgi:zinc D-Ala-D-Ala carboxypeptidase